MLDKDFYELWKGREKPYYKENNLIEYEKNLWDEKDISFLEDCNFGTDEQEHPDRFNFVYDITEPTLTVYPAAGENSGKAVVIIPGGGYELVALYHEGHPVAQALAGQGITAAVLKYRLPNPASSDQPHMVPWSDARRALELLRSKADQYGFQKEQVGVLGFSAGSHIATVTTLWKSENEAENPNFAAHIYGVTNFYGYQNMDWLKRVLYFRELTDQEVAQNTLLDLVTGDTPPTFLVHAYNDPICQVQEATLYAEKLHEHNVPVEMHLFPRGGHGFGLGRKEDGTDQWVQLFINWVKSSVV